MNDIQVELKNQLEKFRLSKIEPFMEVLLPEELSNKYSNAYILGYTMHHSKYQRYYILDILCSREKIKNYHIDAKENIDRINNVELTNIGNEAFELLK